MAVVLSRKTGSTGGGGGPPSGAAGGTLSGTYPNPSLSVAKQAELDGKVPKSLYDANTVLAANADDTPAAITMAASTILARLAAGNIKAASVAEILTLLDTPTNAQAVLKTLYDANTILAADTDNTPAALTMGASTILARLAAGNIKAATPAELRTLLTVEPYGRTTFSNAAVNIVATDTLVAQIGTMSASRAANLPAASAVPAGWEIIVADASGSVTTTNTIVVTRAGADTINGATTTTISAAYGWRRLVSDGVSAWTFDGGVLRSSNNLSDVASASTALANLGGAPALITENIQTASYTLALSDAGLRVVMNVGSANNLTVPTNGAVAFPVGTTVEVFQLGAGQTTFVMTSLTSQSPSGKLKLTGQYSSATLAKRATDTWSIAGDLSA